MPDRKPLSKKIRFEVFKRDSFTCQYCGRCAPDVVLEADHIDPVSQGGDNDIMNLVTSCKDCNAGKSDRLLSDDAVLAKRKAQLDELQERREQIEMLYEWQTGLISLEEEALDKAVAFWDELIAPAHLNEYGILLLKPVVQKYGLAEVLEAMRISASQYIKRNDGGEIKHESFEKATEYIGKICASRRRFAKKPYMKDLYYFRGILRNRFSYVNEHTAIDLMKKAYELGMDLEDIKQVCIDSRNWSEWRETMEVFIDTHEG